MAGLTWPTVRWSRAAARARWTELGDGPGVALTAGIAFAGLWPVSALILQWSDYRSPWAATAMLVVALTVPLALCRLGPRGIGPGTSLLAGASSVLLTVLLGLQLHGTDSGGAHWMNSWGVAVAIVLAFARPVEEPLAMMTGVLIANVAVKPLVPGDVQALHIAPMTIGAAFPAAVCAIALAATMREGIRTARRIRASAEATEQRLAVADAVHQERLHRFAQWEAAVAPLLEDVATGRREPDDPGVGRQCAELSRRLRAELSAAPESLFEMLLGPEIAGLASRGGRVIVHDLDAGYRLCEDDRVLLVELVREVCATELPGTVQVTILDGASDRDALVILGVDGLPAPDGPAWAAALRRDGATTTAESPTRWWWDAEMRCSPAPAIAGPEPGQTRGR